MAEWAPPGWKFIDMVDKWAQLGFVVAKTVANKVEYVEDEDERSPQTDTAHRLNARSSFSAAARRARRRPSRWRAPGVPSWSSRSRITSSRASARRCRPLPGRCSWGWQCGSLSLQPGICLRPASFRSGAKMSCTRLTLSSIPTGKAGISIASDSIECWLKRRGKPGRVSIAAHRSLRACRSLAIVGRSRSHPADGSINSARRS